MKTATKIDLLRMHWKLLTILKTIIKSVWSNVFWYAKVYIFWKFIQYTTHWDKLLTSKKFHLDKINITKYALFFLSRAPTHHSFTFNTQLLHELKYKVYLSKPFFFHFFNWTKANPLKTSTKRTQVWLLKCCKNSKFYYMF